mmetsp:Transcript_22336/g.53581  ORF Transcript_22336/g.53581 Transcript_22336/m.53581 type:complete len:210 (-) Transcript_22336:1459-2088(-)
MLRDDRGRVHQPGGLLHVAHPGAERLTHPVDERRALRGGQRRPFLSLLLLNLALLPLLLLLLLLSSLHEGSGGLGGLDRREVLILELPEVPEDHFVVLVVAEHHLDAPTLESLEVGGRLCHPAVRGVEVVDRVLALLHAVDIVGEGARLLVFGSRRRVPEEVGEGGSVHPVGGHALLDLVAEVLVEVVVVEGVVLRLVAQPLDHPLGQH